MLAPLEPISKDEDAAFKESQLEPPELDKVPDGGRLAWQTVAGCSLAFFATSGSVLAFGVWQSYYTAVLLPDTSQTAISWIASIQSWSVSGLAIPSVLFAAHVGPRVALGVGTFFLVLGLMMASISTKYYQFLLSHGVCVSIGVGISFVPTVALPNQWFSKRRGTAVGIVLAGSSVGGVIWPILINQMINVNKVDWQWVMRTFAFCQLAILIVAISLVRTNITRKSTIKLRNFHEPLKLAIHDPATLIFTLAMLLQMFGNYQAFFFGPVYAQSLGASSSTAFYIAVASNAATFFGRAIMGRLSDSLGHQNSLMTTVAISGMLNFCWQAVTTVPGFFVWISVYGFFSGSSISLQTPSIVHLLPAQESAARKLVLIGPYIAIMSQVTSFGALGGPPIAGQLLSNKTPPTRSAIPSDFYPTMWFSGSMLLASVVFYGLSRVVMRRRNFG